MPLGLTGSVKAQIECNQPPEYFSCPFVTQHYQTQTARAPATQTAAAEMTAGTPAPTATFPPFGLLVTGAPSGTPGVNYLCPEGEFDTDNLEPDWAFACRACVIAVAPTRTQFFPVIGAMPTSNIATVIIPTVGTGTALPPTVTLTPSITPSASVTSSPTPTAMPTVIDINFNVASYTLLTNIAYDGFWQSGLGWRTGADATFDGSNWGYGLLVVMDLGFYIHLRDGTTVTLNSNGNNFVWSVQGFTEWTGQTGQVTLIDGSGALSGDSVQAQGSWNGGGYNGVYTRYIYMYIRGFNSYGAYRNLHLVGDLLWVAPTATPTATITPTTTATVTPSPTWSYPLSGTMQSSLISADCRTPRYIDEDAVLASASLTPSGTVACMTIIPRFNFGFSLINSLLSFLSGSDVVIPDIDVPRVELCFIGVTLVINIFGFIIDMAIIIAFPIAAFMFRWAMRH